MLKRRFTYKNSGKVHHEIQYGITSLNARRANPEKLLEVVLRGGELKMACTIGVMHTRMTRKPMARAMTCINNLVMALLSRHSFSNHAPARRIFDAKLLTALAVICRL
jgi:hypothetical protein